MKKQRDNGTIKKRLLNQDKGKQDGNDQRDDPDDHFFFGSEYFFHGFQN